MPVLLPRVGRMQRELELEGELSASAVQRLAGELPQTELTIGPALTKQLRTIYFVMPTHGLHEAGLSLRLRSQNRGWRQTVKADQRVAGGAFNPLELEALLTTDRPEVGFWT
jgi:triphosphatase